MASLAPGAMPLFSPPDAAPVPATIPATWVPWPIVSSLVPPSTLSSDAIWPLKSSWPLSMPLSKTATTSPAPVHFSPSTPTSGRAWLVSRLGGS